MSQGYLKISFIMAVVLLAILLLPGPQPSRADEKGHAQPGDLTEMSLEELMNVEVYGASKFPQKISEAPSSVSIVTADDIKKYGYRTLADILRSVRGFYVTYDRNYSYLGVRGFNRPGDTNSRILTLVDGHRMTENLYDSSYLGTDFILDVDMIDHVEVVRGPGSSLYGSNAFFAVVNVITRKASDIGGEVSGEAASYKTYKARLSYGKKFSNGSDLVLSGSTYNSKGQQELYFKEFDTPATNNGIAQNADYDRNYNLFSKAGYGDFTMTAAYVSRTKGIPTASYGTLFNDNGTRTTDAEGYVDLLFKRQFSGDADLQARVSYNRYKYDGWYIYDVTVPPGPFTKSTNRDDALGEWIDAELLVSKKLWIRNKITVGAEYRDNVKQDILNFDDNPYFVNTDLHQSSRTTGVFFQIESMLHETLLLNAGLRYDYYTTFGGTTNPRIALIYHPQVQSTIKMIYGTAFRAPNVWETSVADPVSKGNPDLKPETIHNYELVYERKMQGSMMLTIDGYYSEIHGLIGQQTDPADGLLVNQNLGNVTARGIEVELARRAQSGPNWRISYALQRTQDDETGQQLDNSPRQLGTANLTVPLYAQKLFSGFELQYQGSVRTLDGNTEKSFWLMNLTLLGRKFLPNMELSASVYNLFDTRYGYPGAGQHVQDVIEQDGRTYRVKLTYAF